MVVLDVGRQSGAHYERAFFKRPIIDHERDLRNRTRSAAPLVHDFFDNRVVDGDAARDEGIITPLAHLTFRSLPIDTVQVTLPVGVGYLKSKIKGGKYFYSSDPGHVGRSLNWTGIEIPAGKKSQKYIIKAKVDQCAQNVLFVSANSFIPGVCESVPVRAQVSHSWGRVNSGVALGRHGKAQGGWKCM